MSAFEGTPPQCGRPKWKPPTGPSIDRVLCLPDTVGIAYYEGVSYRELRTILCFNRTISRLKITNCESELATC